MLQWASPSPLGAACPSRSHFLCSRGVKGPCDEKPGLGSKLQPQVVSYQYHVVSAEASMYPVTVMPLPGQQVGEYTQKSHSLEGCTASKCGARMPGQVCLALMCCSVGTLPVLTTWPLPLSLGHHLSLRHPRVPLAGIPSSKDRMACHVFLVLLRWPRVPGCLSFEPWISFP